MTLIRVSLETQRDLFGLFRFGLVFAISNKKKTVKTVSTHYRIHDRNRLGNINNRMSTLNGQNEQIKHQEIRHDINEWS